MVTRLRTRVRATLVLLALVVGACAGETPTGPAPPGSTAGPAPAKPAGTFLDTRVKACPSVAAVATIAEVLLVLGPKAAARPLVCRASEGSVDLTYHHLRFVHALILMKELRFDVPLPWTPKTLYEWFSDLGASTYVEMEDGYSTCCSGGSRELHFRVGTSTAEPPIDGDAVFIAIAGLIHEARHIEVGQHPCGERQWDNRVDDLGSWGTQVRFYEFVAKHSDPGVVPIEFRPYFIHRACEFRGILFCREPAGTCVS